MRSWMMAWKEAERRRSMVRWQSSKELMESWWMLLLLPTLLLKKQLPMMPLHPEIYARHAARHL
ncbi:hypothetical protein D3C86_2143210 [compost metagenome]